MMDRTRAFVSNAAWSGVLQVVNIVVGFLVPHAVILTYGSQANGLVSSLTQLISYISLVEAGISAAAIYALYKPLADRDDDAISRIVSAAKVFYYKSGAVFVVLVAVLAAVYPLVVDCGELGPVQVAVIVISLGATGFLDFFTLAKYRVLLTASQRNWVIQIATIVYRVLYTVIILVLAAAHVSLELVYLAAVGPIVLRTIILVVYTRGKYPQIDFSADVQGYTLEQRWDAFYLQILGVVQSGAPLVVATFVTGDLTVVSVFSVYLLVANGVQSLCTVLTSGTQATFGDVITRGEKEVLKRSFEEFQTMMYTLNAIACGVAFVMITPFIDVYTAGAIDADYHNPAIGALVILNVFLYHLKTPQGLLVLSAGMYRATRVQTTVQTLILLVASILLGVFFGIPGIVIGCCVSNLYRDIDLALFIPRRLTGTPVRDTFGRMVLSIVKCLLVLAPFEFIGISCQSWSEWVIWCFVALVWGTAMSVTLALIFERDQAKGLVKRFTSFLPKRKA